ncbi:Gp15 family bacteriophage protein [Cytobacillus kochii]|uniref:Gp15 family bacteriophage protein n=1 Tax=Cytobacillus kochii TaxID=859143 RepID=UPI002E1E0F55|nr:Gp15 family bacteriophage protein [Cytobacillus kochii]
MIEGEGMFSLARKLETSIQYKGKEYELDLSFDNVLLLFELLNDKDCSEIDKLMIAMNLLFKDSFEFDADEMVEVYNYIMLNMIVQGQKKEEQHDLAGNVIEEDEEERKNLYSLEEDAQYIYASFLQDYKINLFDMQGKLHWLEFNALLVSLSDDTMFKKVIDIRQKEPDRHMSAEDKKKLMELKKMYALKKTQEDIEFDAMDLAQKREYILKRQAEEGEKDG